MIALLDATHVHHDPLARARGDRLVTFDRALAALHPDVALLVGEAA